METARLPYTPRNIRYTALLGLVLIAYGLQLTSMQAEMRAHAAAGRPGWEGEAAGLGFAVLVLLFLYTTPFFLGALVQTLERGSRPIAGWLLLLALLPTLLLGLLFAAAGSH